MPASLSLASCLPVLASRVQVPTHRHKVLGGIHPQCPLRLQRLLVVLNRLAVQANSMVAGACIVARDGAQFAARRRRSSACWRLSTAWAVWANSMAAGVSAAVNTQSCGAVQGMLPLCMLASTHWQAAHCVPEPRTVGAVN